MKDLKSKKELDDFVKSGSSVVFFHMLSCPHCVGMMEPFKHLSEKKKGIPFALMESEFVPEKFKGEGFPQFKLYKNGKIAKEVNGGGKTVDELSSQLFGGGSRGTRRFTRRRLRKTRKRTL